MANIELRLLPRGPRHFHNRIRKQNSCGCCLASAAREKQFQPRFDSSATRAEIKTLMSSNLCRWSFVPSETIYHIFNVLQRIERAKSKQRADLPLHLLTTCSICHFHFNVSSAVCRAASAAEWKESRCLDFLGRVSASAIF
jgi:hypothetical protein